MALDPMLFKKFHKPSATPAAPLPANPPPSKEEVMEPKGQPSADDFGLDLRKEAPRATPGADLSEEIQEISEDEALDETVQEEIVEVEVESKEIEIFEPGKEDAGIGFKATLAKLDSLVNSELGISPYTIDLIRSNVKQIMMDLVTQPELDAILIDRDVHNVLAFIRHVKVDAAETRQVTKVKKETKKAKDSKFRNFDLDLSALSGALGGTDSGLPASLEQLSKFK